MPELPEVECVRRGLQAILFRGSSLNAPRACSDTSRVKRLEILRHDLRRPIPARLPEWVRDREIRAIDRRGKYLLWRFQSGSLLCHLGMTGSWRLAPTGSEQVHDHVYLHLQNQSRLAFCDPRRFGVLLWLKPGEDSLHPLLSDLGPEPLNHAAFNGPILFESIHKSRAPIKSLLMNQRMVAGLGNIYASEALFRARIHPQTLGQRISRDRSEALVCAIREVLELAILHGGSSIRDYRNADGNRGGFQNQFQVYGRDGEPCVICSQKIRAEMISGRSTYWCSKCQRR